VLELIELRVNYEAAFKAVFQREEVQVRRV